MDALGTRNVNGIIRTAAVNHVNFGLHCHGGNDFLDFGQKIPQIVPFVQARKHYGKVAHSVILFSDKRHAYSLQRD
jgi:hypothetical protein